MTFMKIAGAIALLVVCGTELPAAQGGNPSFGRSIGWRNRRHQDNGGRQPQGRRHTVGKAIEFDGEDDAIWIEKHPLAGAATFTFEAISVRTAARSNSGGSTWPSAIRRPACLRAPGPRADTNARFLFELRVVDKSWYLDAFVNGPGYSRALMFKNKLHPIGEWYHVAQTYDGKMFRSYVNGVLQGEAEVAFKPQGEGAASLGTRINRVNYFKGAIREARFTPRALTPEEFLKLK